LVFLPVCFEARDHFLLVRLVCASPSGVSLAQRKAADLDCGETVSRSGTSPDLADFVAKVGEETDVSSGDDFSNVGAAASTLW
jgi:hypothetical protein